MSKVCAQVSNGGSTNFFSIIRTLSCNWLKGRQWIGNKGTHMCAYGQTKPLIEKIHLDPSARTKIREKELRGLKQFTGNGI